MSQKNSRHNKKLRALERALRKGRVPTKINLIHWLEDRGYADTAGAARKLLLEDDVTSGSHPLGKQIVERDGEKIEVFNPLVPSNLGNSIIVNSTPGK